MFSDKRTEGVTMPDLTLNNLTIYLLIINILASVLTIYDKAAAIRGKWRISENRLLSIAILGGAVAMFATMQAIRHKTKNSKFMVGLPLIISLQIILYYFY